MILLDTDHLTVLSFPESAQYAWLEARLAVVSNQPFGTTIVNAEEQLRGWIGRIHRHPDVHKQIFGYERLLKLLIFLGRWQIMPFDSAAADEFSRLRKAKVRIGTADLKIAAIAVTSDALLLSANLRDFKKVPGLRVEDWLKP
jgi:tRNA(fMet)-specific endonuclease VapC